MSNRIEKLQSLFNTEISQYWLKFQDDSMVSITRLEISHDIKNMTIWISSLSSIGSTLDQLRKDIPNLVHYLAPRLKIKNIPHITIKVDGGIEYSDHISKIIADINK